MGDWWVVEMGGGFKVGVGGIKYCRGKNLYLVERVLVRSLNEGRLGSGGGRLTICENSSTFVAIGERVPYMGVGIEVSFLYSSSACSL
ncbi:hypothetical protein OUZ56_016996 [Daphnia magna]|uniref:Uncharacterized protein n=1 Tax=Daphnia magna TaxID=35525 RepID=A0ABR0ARV4_9CRUS|nr:hypothetical protein OUZ56_016996 [Daphnia magna]